MTKKVNILMESESDIDIENDGIHTPDDSKTSVDDVQDGFQHVSQPSPESRLALRSRHQVTLDISAIRREESVVISVQPPRQPVGDVGRAPCDIVLVIDVSGSMADPAPLPDATNQAERESTGLSILDLTKHAALTILETLNEHDRLGIVTFSYQAKVVQPLTYMTRSVKTETKKRINALEDYGATNLWAGIQTGLSLFTKATFEGNVQGLYILTDGQPNHMCPPQGYAPKMKSVLRNMADTRPYLPSIHTFGFGYVISSDIMQSIAEVGNGSFAFIPDAGMIGTVFVHAVANLYSTFATAASLQVTCTNGAVFKCTMGHSVQEDRSNSTYSISLGNIQYGQSRDVVLVCDGPTTTMFSPGGLSVQVKLNYQTPDGVPYDLSQQLSIPEGRNSPNISTKLDVSPTTLEYHLNRNDLCTFLSSLFPYADDGGRAPDNGQPRRYTSVLTGLIKTMESRASNLQDPDIRSLLNDVRASSETSSDGQVAVALTQTKAQKYWTKWGCHYLRSLLHAHLKQQCNSFKDPGPLRYGLQSPIFLQSRDQLDNAFDSLPAPTPSLTGSNARRLANGRGAGSATIRYNPYSMNQYNPVSMSRYNSASNPCFLGSCPVKSVGAHGEMVTIKVENLRSGMHVYNGLTNVSREIVAIVQTRTRTDNSNRSGSASANNVSSSSSGSRTQSRGQPVKQQVCRIGSGGLWLTPYHPIFESTLKEWVQPINTKDVQMRDLDENEAVYSLVLAPSRNQDDHAVEIGGVNCVTLGHGLIQSTSTLTTTTTSSTSDQLPNTTTLQAADGPVHQPDARIHPFLGCYNTILQNITNLKQDSQGRYLAAGIVKDVRTGLACRFVPSLQS